MKYSLGEMVQRGHRFAIVDEVDSILIDEARTPLIISGPTEDRSEFYKSSMRSSRCCVPSITSTTKSSARSRYTKSRLRAHRGNAGRARPAARLAL
jgi:hypothetical protein